MSVEWVHWETYMNDNGFECHDACGDILDFCYCECPDCGETGIRECVCGLHEDEED